MRHRTVGCVLVLLLGLALMWPSSAAAQRRGSGRAVSRRAVPAARVVRVAPRVYSRPYYSRSHFYLGLGYSWYPYPYFYGPYADPFWYGGGWYGPWYGGPWYGPWYGRYYYDDYASVRLQASPRVAQVYVDGYFVGVVDDFDGVFQRLRVPPGGHEITLHLNGYRNATEKMYLQPHSTYRLRTQLEPLASGSPQEPPPAPNPAALRTEEGAAGEEREAPEPPGPPSRRWPPREQAERNQPPRDSRFGTLTIRVQPDDAEVIVDGTPWTGTADATGAIAIQVAAGQHQIEVRREGYASFVTELEVRAGASTPLNVMLQREN